MPYAADAARPLPEENTVRYLIDARPSTFTVQAFSTGLLSAFGHNPRIAIRDIQGDIKFAQNGGTIEEARVEIKIRADSLEVVDDISEKDRKEIQRQMYEEVLETDRFPEIAYECSKVSASGTGDSYWVALSGELTLHGATRSLSIPARVSISGASLRASGEFTLLQSDYGIAEVKVAGGAIRLKDDLKFSFNIVARKKE